MTHDREMCQANCSFQKVSNVLRHTQNIARLIENSDEILCNISSIKQRTLVYLLTDKEKYFGEIKMVQLTTIKERKFKKINLVKITKYKETATKKLAIFAT